MNILHVFRTPVGGLFRHVCDLAAEQAARGHRVGVVHDSSTSDALAVDRLEALGSACVLGVHGMPMSRALSHRDISSLVRTRRLLRQLDIDVIHGHGAKGGAIARLVVAAPRWSQPSPSGRPRAFYTPHGGSLHYDRGSVMGRIFLGLERRLDGRTDGLIFESAFSAKAYEAKVGTPSAPTRIMPNGLQAHEFAPVAPGPDAADFVFVGELRQLKGVDVLLRALAGPELSRLASGRPATAVIVGAGPEAHVFQTLAEQLGLRERVRFIGALPARQAFAMGRALVVPSRAESFPYIVLEAAAAGLPLIASRVGGIPKILAGLGVEMVAPDSVEGLGRAMVAVAADDEKARRGAVALRARVADRFTIARMAEGVLGFYAEAHEVKPALRVSGSAAR